MDLTNKRYGRLVVLSRKVVNRNGRNRIFWLCQCDCGNTTQTRCDVLNKGNSQSCGCLRNELTSKRFRRYNNAIKISPAYSHWCSMKTRCYSQNASNYYLYGAIGISVCDRWRYSLENFIADMGQPPDGDYSLDRYPNKFGNYEPDNCRWATQTEQIRNRRNTVMLSIDGITKPAIEWHETHPLVTYDTLSYRVRKGWNHKAALFTPSVPRNQRHLCGVHKQS